MGIVDEGLARGAENESGWLLIVPFDPAEIGTCAQGRAHRAEQLAQGIASSPRVPLADLKVSVVHEDQPRGRIAVVFRRPDADQELRAAARCE
jgi:hypothetical protein